MSFKLSLDIPDTDIPDFDVEMSRTLLYGEKRKMDTEPQPDRNTKKPEHKEVDWTTLMSEQCPLLYKLITKDTGDIDPTLLNNLIEELDLQPCNDKTKNGAECLQRNCAILWSYYVRRKQKHHPHLKRCVHTLVDGKQDASECAEIMNISDHLFNERDMLAFKPGDLNLLYDLELMQGDKSTGILQRIRKKRGDAVLKIVRRAENYAVQGNNIIRFLMVQDPKLNDYFIKVYALEWGTTAQQPSRQTVQGSNLYTLLEAIDSYVASRTERFVSAEQ